MSGKFPGVGLTEVQDWPLIQVEEALFHIERSSDAERLFQLYAKHESSDS